MLYLVLIAYLTSIHCIRATISVEVVFAFIEHFLLFPFVFLLLSFMSLLFLFLLLLFLLLFLLLLSILLVLFTIHFLSHFLITFIKFFANRTPLSSNTFIINNKLMSLLTLNPKKPSILFLSQNNPIHSLYLPTYHLTSIALISCITSTTLFRG